LVEAAQSGRAHYIPQMMPWEIRPEPANVLGPDTVTEQPFDLIFVGSSAPANVAGLTAFYRQVYVPYLRKHRTRLAIVGKVCEHLDFDDWYVTKLGVVKGGLEEYYAQSKVVIIPILEGSGLSIKTLESLASGRAVVTSPVGARGLPRDPGAFVNSDMLSDPRATADAILDLLASEPARQSMQRSARSYYQEHFGRERYFHAMDRVMSSLGIAA
jgi:glycosyltransferase involved in cell wall biosynthesis